jgi:hypothetical protein
MSFRYLDPPISIDPCRVSTWELMLDSLRKWSGTWGNYVNVGHRIVLHNSIDNAIPMFYDLSLFS